MITTQLINKTCIMWFYYVIFFTIFFITKLIKSIKLFCVELISNKISLNVKGVNTKKKHLYYWKAQTFFTENRWEIFENEKKNLIVRRRIEIRTFCIILRNKYTGMWFSQLTRSVSPFCSALWKPGHTPLKARRIWNTPYTQYISGLIMAVTN